MINLSIGEPDIKTPVSACLKAVDAINGGFTKYTEVGGITELREAVSRHADAFLNLHYDADQVVISNGGKQSLYNVFSVLLDDGDEVIIPSPYWVSYPEQVKLAGGKPTICHTDERSGFKVSPGMLETLVSPRTKALLINSPSNPTGAVYTKAELVEIGQFAIKHDLYIISDEIYDRLLYNVDGFVSIAQLSEELRARTIIVNGWSKTYGMTGWRLGYTLSSKALAKSFREFQGHTTANVGSIAQMAAIGALESDVSAIAQRYAPQRKLIIQELQSMEGVGLVVPDGAFYAFPNLQAFVGRAFHGVAITSVDDVCRILLDEYKVSIVPGRGFGAPNNARLSFAIHLERLAQALDRIKNFANQTSEIQTMA